MTITKQEFNKWYNLQKSEKNIIVSIMGISEKKIRFIMRHYLQLKRLFNNIADEIQEIICPGCNNIIIGSIEYLSFFELYHGKCQYCDYIILESEWQEYNEKIK